MQISSDSTRRLFVAGATGAIGRLLVPMLVEAGYDVTATTRAASKAELIRVMGATPVVLDVLDREATLAAVREARPDVVIHQLTDLTARNYDANSRLRVEGTRNLVDAAVAVGVRRMIAQSIAFVYAPADRAWIEEDPLDYDNPGLQTTVEGVQSLESAVSEMAEGLILRYGILYGPGTWNSGQGLTGEQLCTAERTATGAVTSFIHVQDAARVAMLALDWPAGIVNVVDDEPAADTIWLPEFAEAIGAPPPTISGLSAASGHGASNKKARRDLGWEPIYPSWREGFKQEIG